MSYLFVLGRTASLCAAELRAVLQAHDPQHSFLLLDGIVEVTTSLPSNELIKKLGGTIKIAKIVKRYPDIRPGTIAQILSENYKETSLTFGISFNHTPPFSVSSFTSEIKKLLAATFKVVRYVLPKDGEYALSSVVIKKQNVQEIILAERDGKWIVALTQDAQDVDEWTKRDFGRPYADPKTGMLPPKVARMMVNLASSSFIVHGSQSKTLLDPFCGVGTILTEALMVGWDIMGADVSEDMITKTQKNLDWLKDAYSSISQNTFQLLHADATHISEKISPSSVSAIVTEPFLGAPYERKGDLILQKGKRVTAETLHNTFKGLEKLYTGALKEWQSVLTDGGKVVIVLPEVEFQGRVFSVKKMVDSCEKLGYTRSEGPYEYARPQAIVRRQIYVFTVKSS